MRIRDKYLFNFHKFTFMQLHYETLVNIKVWKDDIYDINGQQDRRTELQYRKRTLSIEDYKLVIGSSSVNALKVNPKRFKL
ncbi:hypothetical protein WN51_13829 [Melipona quadrifasciata]|uniref:Uncharacterized protein n=1 Tax=Melipona quadrifasciata TaxID=166423 RepID=A0A0N0U529_9HYME|nr:hypothetical protein WN51_13829 [Melipona quadrifasciata]